MGKYSKLIQGFIRTLPGMYILKSLGFLNTKSLVRCRCAPSPLQHSAWKIKYYAKHRKLMWQKPPLKYIGCRGRRSRCHTVINNYYV